MFTVDMMQGCPAPKRGDLFVTNVGDRRERTWLVLKAWKINRKIEPPKKEYAGDRYKVWAARWWELEPEMRVALWRSAERNGGQGCHLFERYPAKKKAKSFEEYLGG